MKAAIFDVDGTLVDSVDLHPELGRRPFSTSDIPVRSTKYAARSKRGGDQLMPVFLSKEELASGGKEIEDRGDLFTKQYLSQVKLFPQVTIVRRGPSGGRLQNCLASSAKGEEFETYKELPKIADLLENTSLLKIRTRPNCTRISFLTAVKHLGQVLPQECVGNSPYDAEQGVKPVPQASGFWCVGSP